MNGLKRTCMCTEVTEAMVNQTVTVMGWVHKRRDLGQLIFISLRDRTGLVQIVVRGDDAELFQKAESIRGEFVIAAKGKVVLRTEENINPEMITGKIEIEAEEICILSEADVPPFQTLDTNVKEDMRLKYRYLDLRRPELQKNLIQRHKITKYVREFLEKNGFLDIETPVLTKSTPEGARDYIIPSRVNPGNFYALPQSPQIFKQLLMVSGFDRYYQIVKCFRDEDLRADRQPEFTQIDMEMSFVDVDDVIEINEKLIKHLFKTVLNQEIETPFLRLPYKEAMERFGSDKPDMRFDMELKNISDIVVNSSFNVFDEAIQNGGSVRGINVKGNAKMSRRQIDALTDFVKEYRAKGLMYISVDEENKIKTSLSKFLSEEKLNEILQKFDAQPNDLILICADKSNKIVFDALGNLRVHLAKKLDLIKNNVYKFLWVTEFPLLEWNEDDNRFYAMHHPFTMPMDEDIKLLDISPDKVRAKAYDIVLNGSEIGGGSIRITNRQLQQKMFNLLNLSEDDAQDRFGFLLEAFKYGVPPHGGLAYGLDRIVMLLTGCEYIRDVIAFPKTKDASCPLTGAPSTVYDLQLNELAINIDPKIKDNN